MSCDVSPQLPAKPLPDDVIDIVAKEIAAEVAEHIESQYPKATEPVAWQSMKRSLSGVIRNHMAAAGRAAETGKLEEWVSAGRASRSRRRQWRGAEK